MKPIEKSGVSPWPWTADDWSEAQHGEYDVRIRDAGDNEIAQPLSTQNDANMMAAAPELYEALIEAIEDKCVQCKASWYGGCVSKYGSPCSMVYKWRAALAKAAGKEATK